MAYTLFQEPPTWFRKPGSFVGVSFCAAEVNFAGAQPAPMVRFFSLEFGTEFG